MRSMLFFRVISGRYPLSSAIIKSSREFVVVEIQLGSVFFTRLLIILDDRLYKPQEHRY